MKYTRAQGHGCAHSRKAKKPGNWTLLLILTEGRRLTSVCVHFWVRPQPCGSRDRLIIQTLAIEKLRHAFLPSWTLALESRYDALSGRSSRA